jgi:hypothetical protein
MLMMCELYTTSKIKWADHRKIENIKNNSLLMVCYTKPLAKYFF